MAGMSLKFTPAIIRHLLSPLNMFWVYGWHTSDSQLVQTHLTESLTYHQLPTSPNSLLPTNPSSIMCHLWYYSGFDSFEKVAQNPAALLASRSSYKILAKILSQLHNISGMATIQHKKTTRVLTFEIGISQNTKCDNLVGFPRSVHKCEYRSFTQAKLA